MSTQKKPQTEVDPLKPSYFNYTVGDMPDKSVINRERKKASEPEINNFAFELQNRQYIEKLLKPSLEQQVKDRQQTENNVLEISRLQDRCYQLELLFD